MTHRNFGSNFNHLFSIEEIRLLPHIKRYIECAMGDSEFKSRIANHNRDFEGFLKSRGIIGVELAQMNVLLSEIANLKPLMQWDVEDKPQVKLWQNWVLEMHDYRERWKQLSDESMNEDFNYWRMRQKNRCHNQLSKGTNDSLIHATVAFELSSGCSMQCSFCGLESKPLDKVFRYNKANQKMWRAVLEVVYKHLGASMAFGACYWGTEPTDNPDYHEFLLDFKRITGLLPQTTTAAPLRNFNWTATLLKNRTQCLTAVDRFSILTEETLRRVHETFSSEALAHTELILQYTDLKKQTMASSGRNRNQMMSREMKDHTIACVTGYIINMTDGMVKLVSPCPPSETNPLGYIVFDECKFKSAPQLDLFFKNTMAMMHPKKIGPTHVITLMEGISIKSIKNGFELHSEYKTYKFYGKPHLESFGYCLNDGRMTMSEIIDSIFEESIEILDILSIIQSLSDYCLIKDENIF